MASSSKDRGFDEISVWKAGIQHSWERFRLNKRIEDQAKETFQNDTSSFMGGGSLESDSESEGEADELNHLLELSDPFDSSQDGKLPRTATWRLNLTAISQKYNLYFVACGAEILCYRPEGIFQRLRKDSHFILPYPITKAGCLAIGGLDNVHPHDANHLIVREFGSEEILLIACDDGDVMAYNTLSLANYADLSDDDLGAPLPQPFFHQNVKNSAWGLDVHSQSRLIAVSSNLREVQIFCFAMNKDSSADCPPVHEVSKEEFPTCSVYELPRNPHILTTAIKRETNFKIIKPLDNRGHNIPAIAFTSQANGEAESVIATDIRGNLWDLPIWTPEFNILSNSQQHGISRALGMGWGVLVLPSDFFSKATSRKEAFGFALSQCENDGSCDITSSLGSVPQNSLYHPRHPDRQNDPTGTALAQGGFFNDDEEDDDESDLEWNEIMDDIDDIDNDGPPSDLPVVAKQAVDYGAIQHTNSNLPAHSAGAKDKHKDGRNIIFHTYSRQMRILTAPGYKRIKPVFCNDAACQHLPDQLIHLNALDRLSMLIPIPELNLIVAGSQIGRVVLVTMTRLSSKLVQSFKYLSSGKDTAKYGMRLERILPPADEEDKGMRPYSSLLGISAAPLQDAKGRRDSWRLLLHYQDFTILSYLLERKGDRINADLESSLF